MEQLPSEIEREIVVLVDESTNPKYGTKPEDREIAEHIENAVINLDKPKGPHSHQVTDSVKKIFKAKKAGHGGTLDPGVTGVLPVALNNATKIMPSMLYSGKEYIGLMHLHGDVGEEEVKQAMKKLLGTITQLPPVRSHVKRVKRQRKVYYLEFLEKNERDVLFKAGVERGTYIRRLCEQIGDKVGVSGHMTELRRTKAGGFFEEGRLVTLQDLEDAYYFWQEEGNEKFLRYCLQPMENAIQHLPKIWVLDSAIDSICHGAMLAVPGVSKFEKPFSKKDLVAVMSLKNELVGLGHPLMDSKTLENSKKGMVLKTTRVTMKPGTYPKYSKEQCNQ